MWSKYPEVKPDDYSAVYVVCKMYRVERYEVAFYDSDIEGFSGYEGPINGEITHFMKLVEPDD